MPILHTCGACGARVSEKDVLAGKAKRDGSVFYCTECSALILEPEEVEPVAVGLEDHEAARPTSKQQRISGSIQVMEEFEIMSAGTISDAKQPVADVPKSNPRIKPAASSRRAGATSSRSNVRPAPKSGRDDPAPSARGAKKEVFYKSGGLKAARLKQEAEEQEAEADFSATARKESRRSKSASKRSQATRMSRKIGRGDGGNNNMVIICGAIGVVLLLGVFLFMMSGSGGGGGGKNKSNNSAPSDTSTIAGCLAKARDAATRNDSQTEMDCYYKAASIAQANGNDTEAQGYMEKYYAIQKHTVLHLKK